MFCITCGNKMADSDKFCNNCGTPVHQTVPHIIPDTVITERPPEVTPVQAVNSVGAAEGIRLVEPMTMPFPETLPDDDLINSVFPKENLEIIEHQDVTEAPQEEVKTEEIREETAPSFEKENKVYIGKPAMAFFIILIAVLSITCGVFIGLFLNNVGAMPRLNSILGSSVWLQ